MRRISGPRRRACIALASAIVMIGALHGPLTTSAASNLVLLSTDPFTNTSSAHKTQVEPDVFAHGSTIVSVFQSGRFFNGGSSDIGWATSTDSGATWKHGFMPGTTVYAGGRFGRVSDPAVTYDAKHKLWLAVSLPLSASGSALDVIVNRSLTGLAWTRPVTVTTQSGTDKSWIACDNTATSPFYGHCYAEWDNNGVGDVLQLSVSTDGGQTWGPAKGPGGATGSGGLPLVQPNGTVIVPGANAFGGSIQSFKSTNGGASWSAITTVTPVSRHQVGGGLRAPVLPGAAIDAAGKVYVVWYDCRFEAACSANDIVMSTSTNGTSWSPVTRIPIDAKGSGIDHFLPGLGIEAGTSGGSAHLGLVYYYYPNANCSTTCRLTVGFISSTDGGATWSAKTTLFGPMQLSWLAPTSQGPMVGDYFATAFSGGKAYPVFMLAAASSGSTYHEAAFTTSGLALGPDVASVANDQPVSSGVAQPSPSPLTHN